MDMVERVARALLTKRTRWEDFDVMEQEWAKGIAREMIAAMREPTEAMMQDVTRGDWWDNCGPDDIWRAMIDNALIDRRPSPAPSAAPSE